MRASMVSVALVLVACGSRGTTDRVAPDASSHDAALDAPDSASPEDFGPHDFGPAPDLGALDLGTLDLGAPDIGSADLGPPDLGPPDLGPADLGAPDLGPADLGPPDLGPPPTDAGGGVFVLGAPLADCNTTCGAIGRACGGSGSVGLDCGAHMDLATCDDPRNWIFRSSPIEPAPYCLMSWGTSDACTNNYNTYNSFCCRCL